MRPIGVDEKDHSTTIGQSLQAKGTKSISFLTLPRVLSPLRSLCVRNEVDLVPLACEDGFCITAVMEEIKL